MNDIVEFWSGGSVGEDWWVIVYRDPQRGRELRLEYEVLSTHPRTYIIWLALVDSWSGRVPEPGRGYVSLPLTSDDRKRVKADVEAELWRQKEALAEWIELPQPEDAPAPEDGRLYCTGVDDGVDLTRRVQILERRSAAGTTGEREMA